MGFWYQYSRPNKKIMKFKKAHETLTNVVYELVRSDKYFSDGDLGVRVNGTIIDGTLADANDNTCVNERPFAFGIRPDWKIIPGARAQEWLEKYFQDKKDKDEQEDDINMSFISLRLIFY